MLSQGIAEGDITPMSDLTLCQQASGGRRAAHRRLPDFRRLQVQHNGDHRPPLRSLDAIGADCPGPAGEVHHHRSPDLSRIRLRLAFDDFSYPAYNASQAYLPLTSKQWQERNIIGRGRGAGWRAETQGEAGKVHGYNCRVFCTLLTGRESPWLTVLPSRL